MSPAGVPAPPPYPTGKALLDGKTVLVTAAAGTGIGFATAQRCAEEGARLVVSDAHERRLGEAAEKLGDAVVASDARATSPTRTRCSTCSTRPSAPPAGSTSW